MSVPFVYIFLIIFLTPFSVAVDPESKLIGRSRQIRSGHLAVIQDPIQAVEVQILPSILRKRRQYNQQTGYTFGGDASLIPGRVFKTGYGADKASDVDSASMGSLQGNPQAGLGAYGGLLLEVQALAGLEGRAHGDQYNGGNRRHYSHNSQPTTKVEPAKGGAYKSEVATVVKYPPVEVAPVVVTLPVPAPPATYNQTYTEEESEEELFATALAAGLALGLTKIKANIFADSLSNIQLVFQANSLEASEDTAGLATAFDNAIIAGSFQAMNDIDYIHFAAGVVPINVIHGVQDPAAMAPYADTYATALAIGLQSLMGKKQATEFAKSVIRIQSDLGGQSVDDVRILGIAYQTKYTVGLAQGMTQTQVVRFATVMLQIRARLGAMPLATLTSYAQQFVADVLTATQQGLSPTKANIFAQVGMLARAGVGNLLQPAYP